jgi:FlaA1/EpsC-like NDP-sugar epimerase
VSAGSSTHTFVRTGQDQREEAAMGYDFTGKVTLVTGGAGGIGTAV